MKGAAKSAAEKVNQRFIVEQRADMRGRLVQAAMSDELKHGQAYLLGFTSATAINLDALDEEDSEDEE